VDLEEVILEIGKGIAPEESVDALSQRVDAEKALRLRLDVSLYYLSRSSEERPNFAAEHLYRAVHEALKGLAQYMGYRGTAREVVPLLCDTLGDWIEDGWEAALTLHYDGYMDGNLDEGDIKFYEGRVKEFLARCFEVLN
jgi:Archaeal PaREP1/PaREP8 family.